MIWWGRAFELSDGTIILPCEFCGTPCWFPDKHMCEGLHLEILVEMMKRDLEEEGY